MSLYDIATIEQVKDLPPGQWVLTEKGEAFCIFDTHMGFPQRMWGYKAERGTKGDVRNFMALDQVPLPLGLADVVPTDCLHRRTNECGQCLFCGKPGITDGQPLYFSNFDGALIREVAEHNESLIRSRAKE